MSNRNNELLKWIGAGYVVTLIFCSLYITGFINNRLKDGPRSFGIMDNVFSFVLIGFPGWLFTFVLFALTGVSLYAIHYFNSEPSIFKNKKTDELDRYESREDANPIYGDIHFGQPEDYRNIAVIQDVNEAYGDILGLKKVNSDGTKLVINTRVDIDDRLHWLVIAPTRQWKTVFVVDNKIFQAVKRQESLVCHDPKGELTEIFAPYGKEHGIPVFIFNVQNPRKSDGLNLFSLIHEETAIDDAKKIAEVWLTNTPRQGQGEALALVGVSELSGIILRVYFGTDFADESVPDEQISKDFFLREDKPDYKPIPGVYIGRKDFGSVFDMVFCDGGIKELEGYFTREVLEATNSMKAYHSFKTFKGANERFKPSVHSTVCQAVEVMEDEYVRKMLCTDGIDFVSIGERPTMVFCVTPSLTDSYQSVISLFFKLAVDELYNYALSLPEQKLKIPVNFVLDEFANIGIIPKWEGMISIVGSTNINLTMILQDLGQLATRYKNYESIVANSGIKLILGVGDNFTVSYFEKYSGKFTTKVISEHFSQYNGSQSYTEALGKKELLEAADFFFKKKENCFIFLPESYPVVAKKFPYWDHPEYEKLKKNESGNKPARTKIASMPDIGSPERDQMIQEMWQEVKEYERKHGDPREIDRSYKGKCVPYDEKHPKKSVSEHIKSFIPSSLDNFFDSSTTEQVEKAPGQYSGPVIHLEESDFEVLAGIIDEPENEKGVDVLFTAPKQTQNKDGSENDSKEDNQIQPDSNDENINRKSGSSLERSSQEEENNSGDPLNEENEEHHANQEALQPTTNVPNSGSEPLRRNVTLPSDENAEEPDAKHGNKQAAQEHPIGTTRPPVKKRQ